MKSKTGTREWAESNENCISGCSNSCKYCYARDMAIRYKRETAGTWPIEHPRATAKARKHKGRVMFPTTHDLHYEHVNWWGPFLRDLLERGNDVLIVSKPEYAADETGTLVSILNEPRFLTSNLKFLNTFLAPGNKGKSLLSIARTAQ